MKLSRLNPAGIKISIGVYTGLGTISTGAGVIKAIYDNHSTVKPLKERSEKKKED